MIKTRNLMKNFGGLTATQDVTFTLEKGARHALIGPNGAGKTTFINLLTGVLKPSSGEIFLNNENITNFSQEKRVKRGLVRTFQINQLFPQLSVLEQVGLVLLEQGNKGLFKVFKPQHEAEEILSRFGLENHAHNLPPSLPYGKQRLLELALAFAAKPSVLLLDEPAAGVPENEREGILSAINALPQDVSVLLIEHDMDLVFSFAKKITVLVQGTVLCEGTVQEISIDPRVKAVYLGEGE
jgi:branched-chain amino acid transport system ATP-binding protein